MKNLPQIAVAKNKLVIFGSVDLLDDEDVNADGTKEGEDKGHRLENFIKNHKTPFSKTITIEK